MDNATLLRIDRRTGQNAAGEPIFAHGRTQCLRCWAEDLVVEKFTSAARVADATAVVFLPCDAMAAAGEAKPTLGDRITYQIDGDNPVTEEVLTSKNRQLGSISHFETFTKQGSGGAA